ncbi:MAG TPA: hypothetical protein VII44_10300 [Puia sp.]
MMKTLRENISGKSRRAILPLALMTISLVSYAGGSLPVPSAVMITKNLNNKRHKVRLFIASDNKTLLFTVNGVEGKQYTLFVFDLEGKLIMQSVILNRETGILPEISAGNYLYEVLVEDTKVENGRLKVK